MGIRLKGESLISSESHDILSEGILPGSIQVPSDGQPIILAGHSLYWGISKNCNFKVDISRSLSSP